LSEACKLDHKSHTKKRSIIKR